MQLTPEELKNLSSLLLSTDDNNTQIAFEILEAQTFPKELFTEAFVVFKLSENTELKRKAAAFLYQQGSSNVSQIMSRDLRLTQKGQVAPTEQTIKKNIDSYVEMSYGELDGMKMAFAMYNKYNVGLKYLLDRLPIDLKKELLKTFISGTSFKLNNCALTKIPTELYDFTELTEIDLSDNKIKIIPAKIKAFEQLESLNISNNSISKLNKALTLLPNLKRLNISNNKFVEFPAVICQLSQLEYLNMVDLNHLLLGETIPVPPEISQLKQVKEIKACNNNSGSSQGLVIDFKNFPNFTTLKSNNGKGLDLTPLNLAQYAYEQNGRSEGVLYLLKHSSDQQLIQKIIEEQFYNSQSKTLDLKQTILLNIPNEISHYEIEHVNFNRCFLGIEHYISGTKNTYRNWALLDQKALDQCFLPLSCFPNIKTADLSNNRLATIPNPVLNWSQLKKMDLAHNALKDISSIVAKYPHLEELHLSNNQLTALPKDISKLKKLKRLTLSNNLFDKVPEEIGHLFSLEELKFDSCLTPRSEQQSIFEIPLSWINLKNLKKIHFYESRLYYDHDNLRTIYRKRLQQLLPPSCEIYMEYL
ncbi:leucine-rich repeat domain-containing protein [Aureispira anguillae]|uniref:Leucine-rich repeat domain-containing protein n=1 Tax=Aureispira anguillae TaxID=2864201 RepID=A0A915YDE0_9BACT|nr:leucine-rich repeat domain-containing protein [Aureispira anguillae]BDS11010.1 leucine-rich repeat domain-containing protein [Aureispira anguillae]